MHSGRTVYQLPYDLKAQFLVSQPADADVGTRDGLRLYGGQPGELEMMGTIDLRGSVLHGRVAKEKIADNLTVGVNYLGVVFDDAIIYEPDFKSEWEKSGRGTPVLLNTHVASVDVKGNITPKLFLMADLGIILLWMLRQARPKMITPAPRRSPVSLLRRLVFM